MFHRRAIALFALAIQLNCSSHRWAGASANRPAEEPRILLKQPADSAPHQVALVYAGYAQARNGYFCAGSLIAPDWVVTAAHCLSARTKASDLNVAAGSRRLSKSELVAVTDVIRHERFDRNRMTDDIALLHLARAVAGTHPITVADLQIEKRVLERTSMARASGWGSSAPGIKDVSNDLMFVDVPIVDSARCKKSYGDGVTDSMICAGRDLRDVCNGDSGGGLTVALGNRIYLEGIVSWGDSCGSARPGVYTRVPSYSAWIAGHITRPHS